MRQTVNPSELLSSQYFSRILKSEELQVDCLMVSGKILVPCCWIYLSGDLCSCSSGHLDHSILPLKNRKKKLVIVRYCFYFF